MHLDAGNHTTWVAEGLPETHHPYEDSGGGNNGQCPLRCRESLRSSGISRGRAWGQNNTDTPFSACYVPERYTPRLQWCCRFGTWSRSRLSHALALGTYGTTKCTLARNETGKGKTHSQASSLTPRGASLISKEPQITEQLDSSRLSLTDVGAHLPVSAFLTTLVTVSSRVSAYSILLLYCL